MAVSLSGAGAQAQGGIFDGIALMWCAGGAGVGERGARVDGSGFEVPSDSKADPAILPPPMAMDGLVSPCTGQHASHWPSRSGLSDASAFTFSRWPRNFLSGG